MDAITGILRADPSEQTAPARPGLHRPRAQVAELVDALASGASGH